MTRLRRLGMLKIDHLSLFIGDKHILRDITADYAAYRIHGIIGPNGAGKSSLLKTICRIWEPQSGTVFINGSNYRELSRKELSQRITLVPQNTSIGFPISVYDIVAMGRNPHLGRFQSLTSRDRDIIDWALQTTQVFALKNRQINELSGGEFQLAVLARALATEAAILLLDEPTSDLDIRHALDIMELLEEFKHEGKTILINIHDLNLAARYCDTISIICGGNLKFKGLPSEALSRDRVLEVFGVQIVKIDDGSNTALYFSKSEAP